MRWHLFRKSLSADKIPAFGNPDFKSISTCHIERFNLTVRMTMRRFTRLINAQGKRQWYAERSRNESTRFAAREFGGGFEPVRAAEDGGRRHGQGADTVSEFAVPAVM